MSSDETPRTIRPDPGSRPARVPPETPGLWPGPVGSPWHLRLYWDLVDGRIECVGIEVKSIRLATDDRRSSAAGWEPKPTALTSSILRDLNISSVIDGTKEGWARHYEWWSQLDESLRVDLEEKASELRDSRRKTTRAGRLPKYGPDHFRKVAEFYSTAFRTSRRPTQLTADEFGVSKSTAAKWISRSRDMGFLPKTTRGKPRGARGEDPKEKA